MSNLSMKQKCDSYKSTQGCQSDSKMVFAALEPARLRKIALEEMPKVLKSYHDTQLRPIQANT